jgi:hypothetical protein
MAISKKSKRKQEDMLTSTHDLKSADEPTQYTYTVDIDDSGSCELPSVTQLLNRKSYLEFKKKAEELTKSKEKTKKLSEKKPEVPPLETPGSNVIPLKAKAANRLTKHITPNLIQWDRDALLKSKTVFERWVGTILSLGAESALYFERSTTTDKDQMNFTAKAGVFNQKQATLWKGMEFSSTPFKELIDEIEKNGWVETKNTPELSKLFGTTMTDQLALVGFRMKGELHALVAFVSTKPFSEPAIKLFKKVPKKQDTTQIFKKAS